MEDLCSTVQLLPLQYFLGYTTAGSSFVFGNTLIEDVFAFQVSQGLWGMGRFSSGLPLCWVLESTELNAARLLQQSSAISEMDLPQLCVHLWTSSVP